MPQMNAPDLQQVRTECIAIPAFRDADLHVDVLRTDLLHPVISGNKWYKLRFYLEEAIQKQVQLVVTFGGPWSNHIVATAAACKWKGIPCAGIIRGEEPEQWSDTLLEAKHFGMQLFFSSREDFRAKKIRASLLLQDPFIIAEGGYGEAGVQGAATMLDDFKLEKYSHIVCAVGTGTMIAGLLQRALPQQQVTGIPVLKVGDGFEQHIIPFLKQGHAPYKMIYDYHFGGYAKQTDELITFMNELHTQTSVPTDFVYTGKLFYAVNDLAQKGYFPEGSSILIVHSGGLQGNRSLEKGTLNY